MPCDPGFHCQAKEMYTEDRGTNPTPLSQRDAEHLSLTPGAGWIPSVPLQRVGGAVSGGGTCLGGCARSVGCRNPPGEAAHLYFPQIVFS